MSLVLSQGSKPSSLSKTGSITKTQVKLPRGILPAALPLEAERLAPAGPRLLHIGCPSPLSRGLCLLLKMPRPPHQPQGFHLASSSAWNVLSWIFPESFFFKLTNVFI